MISESRVRILKDTHLLVLIPLVKDRNESSSTILDNLTHQQQNFHNQIKHYVDLLYLLRTRAEILFNYIFA